MIPAFSFQNSERCPAFSRCSISSIDPSRYQSRPGLGIAPGIHLETSRSCSSDHVCRIQRGFACLFSCSYWSAGS